MINFDIRHVIEVIKDEELLQILRLDDGNKAYNYPLLTGKIKSGEEIVVNTTAVDLALGTGGYHFVINKLYPKSRKDNGPGHIMKLRYTPGQIKTYTLEEELGEELDKVSFKGHKVITLELHSMLSPLVLGLKKLNPSIRICYVMTDGGALPAYHSETIQKLKKHRLIEGVVTTGHAFGGDLESVNFVTAIQGSIKKYNADITIIGMGPGIVGTGTKYGFTGIEQGIISDAAQNLGCLVFPAIRLGFADVRDRHRGISHHFITNFSNLTRGKYTFVLPIMERDKITSLLNQMHVNDLRKKHQVRILPSVDIVDFANKFDIKLSTMGRGYPEDPHYFDTLTALARYVTKLSVES